MNTKTEAENKAATTADAPSNPPAADDEDDFLKGVTPQASCNLDGTCESCQ